MSTLGGFDDQMSKGNSFTWYGRSAICAFLLLNLYPGLACAQAKPKSNASPAQSAKPAAPGAKPATVAGEVYTGYLIDRSCAAAMKMENKGLDNGLKQHTRHCSLEPSCSESGYSLYSGGKWFDLDPKGNEMARKYFQASKKEAGHIFKITGVFKRNELRVATISENK